MLLHLYIEVQVTRRSITKSRTALARDPQLLAAADTTRNAHADRSRHATAIAVLVPFEAVHLEGDLGALERLVERDLHAGFVIVPAPGSRGAFGALASTTAAEGCEQVREIDVLERASALRELLFPIGWRPEFLAGSVTAELIVRRALFRVLERLVRLGHFLEFFLCVLFLR